MTKQMNIREYLLENMEVLKSVVQSLNSWNGSFEDLEAWENDEEFFKTFFHDEPYKAVTRWHYGECNYNDDYIRFGSDGNLETLTEYDYHEELKDNIDEIVEVLMDTPQQHIYITPELKELLNEEEEENEEE